MTFYELDGNSLRLAGHEPGDPSRPAGFEPSQETRVFVFTRK